MICNSYFDDQKIILNRPFFAQIDMHNDRVFHSHNFIEMAYVVSGSADHVMVFPDGRMEKQKIIKGNYIILDTRAKHAYKNGSNDFLIYNLLFKPSFLFPTLDNSRSLVSPKAFSITRSEWHEEKDANGIEIKFSLKAPQLLGAKKYVRMWLDLSGDSGEIDFSEARVGLIVNNDVLKPYYASGDSKLPFYFMGEVENKWITMYHGKSGYFGSSNGSSVKGLKGWFAFPVDDMRSEKKGRALSGEDVITGVYFYYAMSDKSMAGKYLYVDDLVFVEDYRLSEQKALIEDKVIDFGDSVLRVRVSVSGKNGNFSAEVYPDQIKVSVFEDEDLYQLIKGMYPEFNYKKVPTTPVNQVYFDKDGEVFSLFKMCHDSSRQNWHGWHQIVRHGLSLILILSLQSYDKWIRPKKESIIDIVKKYVEAHYAEDITLTEICEKNFYSVPYVSHKFKDTMKCSFEQYLRQTRIKHAGELLLNSTLQVGEIAEKCGYTSVRSFRKAFVLVTGDTPIEFKKKYNK